MAVIPVSTKGVITYVGAPSARLEAPGEDTQLLEKKWADFPGPILFVAAVPANSYGIDGQTAVITTTGQVWQKVDAAWTYTEYTLPGAGDRFYGSFYDTTTQTAPDVNTPTAITYNNTDLTNGVSIVSNSRVTIANTGIYSIQFSTQVDKTSGSGDLLYIWLRKKGVDVAWSNSELAISGTLAQSVPAWNWFVSATAGDYYEIMWSVPDTKIQLVAKAAFDSVPGIPSIILTVQQVM